jgi:hypothetical protein
MAAVAKVPERVLWVSFPEANRNEVLRLLSMILERLTAVPAGPAADRSGGERGAGR